MSLLLMPPSSPTLRPQCWKVLIRQACRHLEQSPLPPAHPPSLQCSFALEHGYPALQCFLSSSSVNPGGSGTCKDLGTVCTGLSDCWWVWGAVRQGWETRDLALASQAGIWEREGESMTQSLRMWVVDSNCLCPDPAPSPLSHVTLGQFF